MVEKVHDVLHDGRIKMEETAKAVGMCTERVKHILHFELSRCKLYGGLISSGNLKLFKIIPENFCVVLLRSIKLGAITTYQHRNSSPTSRKKVKTFPSAGKINATIL